MLAKQAEAAANVEGKGAVAAAAAGEAEATTCASAVADASGPGREMVTSKVRRLWPPPTRLSEKGEKEPGV